jgi:hypothetical protein
MVKMLTVKERMSAGVLVDIAPHRNRTLNACMIDLPQAWSKTTETRIDRHPR